MHGIDGSAIDLNLLVVLDVLLREGSVTAAAARLGIGQPAVSHALGRLRTLFGDALFVRTGRGLTPTPRALALQAPLARILSEASGLVRAGAAFDPRTSSRRFVVSSPDALATVLPRVMARLAREAPHARLEIVARGEGHPAALEAGRVDLTLGAGAPPTGGGLRTRRFGKVHFVIVARRGHPALRGKRLTKEAWSHHPHVVVESGSQSPSIVAEAAQRSGVHRTVGLVVPSFLLALAAVAETDLLFAAPRELLAPVIQSFDLVTAAPPVSVPPVPTHGVWHERHDAEPGHRFLRALVFETLAQALRV